jgi:hypothetical protein
MTKQQVLLALYQRLEELSKKIYAESLDDSGITIKSYDCDIDGNEIIEEWRVEVRKISSV